MYILLGGCNTTDKAFKRFAEVEIQLGGSKTLFNLHYRQKINMDEGFQFLDFRLKPFVDPMPVEPLESAILQKFCLSKLV